MTATDQLAAPITDRDTRPRPGRALGWAFTMTFADRAVWRRLLTMAVGIGICSLALLALVSVPPTLDRMAAGSAALLPTAASSRPGAFSFQSVSFAAGGETVTGLLLVGSAEAPPPPGAATFPKSGDMYVSPRLAAALAATDGADLRTLLPGRVVGVLPVDRLRGADDLFFYRATDPTVALSWLDPASGWGRDPSNEGLDPELWMLLATGSIVMLIPLMLFVGLASRLGSARRERRNGVLALLGAGFGRIRLLGAVESGVAGLLGVGLGLGALLLLRQFANRVRFEGVGVRSDDIGPTAAGLWWVSIGIVAAAAVSGSFIGYRPADAARPQGSIPLRRTPFRWWWRVLLLAVTAGSLWWMLALNRSGGLEYRPEALRVLLPCAATLLVLLTLVSISAPLVAVVGRFWRPSSTAGQLARGRILADGTLTTRSAAALATVLAGVITLMPLLSSGSGDRSQAGADAALTETYGQLRGTVRDIPLAELAARRSNGLRFVGIGGQIGTDATGDGHGPSVAVVNCSAVQLFDPSSACRDGDVFRVPRADPTNDPLSRPPYRITLVTEQGFTDQPGATRVWTPPARTRVLTVAAQDSGSWFGLNYSDFLLTPAAAAREFPQLATTPFSLTVAMQLEPGTIPQEQLALSPLGDRAFALMGLTSDTQSVTPFRPLITGALVAVAALVLLISALAQILTTVEQTRERKRPYALGRAAGLPLSLLSLSIGLSLVVPILVTMVAAVGAGLLLNLVLGDLLQIQHAAIDWPLIAVGIGAAVLAAVLVALGASWSLQRSTRPAAMRTE